MMTTEVMKQFEVLDMETLEMIEGGTDWDNVKSGAVYGAGIGVSFCAAIGVFTGGATWAATTGCAWAGAKIGASFVVIADNVWR